MIKVGDRLNLKNGHTATVTRTQIGDFIGDPRLLSFQYVKNGKVVIETAFENKFKAGKEKKCLK